MSRCFRQQLGPQVYTNTSITRCDRSWPREVLDLCHKKCHKLESRLSLSSLGITPPSETGLAFSCCKLLRANTKTSFLQLFQLFQVSCNRAQFTGGSQWDLKHKCRFLRGFCVLSLCRCGDTQHADVEFPAVLLHRAKVRYTIGRELICPNNGHLTYDCWSFPIFVHDAVGNLFKVINRGGKMCVFTKLQPSPGHRKQHPLVSCGGFRVFLLRHQNSDLHTVWAGCK